MMRTLNQLTTPTSYLAKQTCNAISGALIGAATLKSANGAISSALASYALPSLSSPRTKLITSIAFATIKTAIDHYLPNQPIISICASLLPVLGLAHCIDVHQIVLVASLGLVGTYLLPVVSHIAEHHYQTVALAASIGGEILFSMNLGIVASLYLWPKHRESISPKPFLYLSVGLAASFIATHTLWGSHNLYLHTGLLTGVTLVSSLVIKYFHKVAAPVRHAPPPVPQQLQPPQQRLIRRDPPAAVQAVAPAPQRRVSFQKGIPDDLKEDPIFRLFKCGATDKPICFNPCVHVNSNSLLECNHKVKRQYSSLIQLPKVEALLEERRMMYLIGNPVRMLDKKFIREAHDELVKICPRLKIIPELKKLLDYHQTPPLMFPMENVDSSSDSDTDDRMGLTELLSPPVQHVERDIFANGIPEHLKNDPIFSLFKCCVSHELICFDPRLNPHQKMVCDGYYSVVRDHLIPLPKIKTLIEVRKKMCRLDSPNQRLDVRYLREAHDELLRLCPDSRILPKLKNLIDSDETDSDNEDFFRASPLRLDGPFKVSSAIKRSMEAQLEHLLSRHPVGRNLFANGIPENLKDDCIFSLFKCPLTNRPIWFDPKYDCESRKICEMGSMDTRPLPKVEALIDERAKMYEQGNEAELPSFDALSSAYWEITDIDPNLEVLRELNHLIELKRSELRDNNSSDNSPPDSPRIVNSNNPVAISFAEGIPSELEGDMVFRLFECGIGQGSCCDLVLDPTDKKTFYNRKSIKDWLGRNSTSPITRGSLTFDKLIEMPKLNRLITERQEFYQKTKLPIAQALNTLPVNLECVREALKEMETKCPEAEAYAGLRSIEQSMIDKDSIQWNFEEKIPPQLRDDCVFKLFICPLSNTPIYDCVLDPNKKTIYEQKCIDTWLINMKNSPATGKPLKKEDLIPLSQVSLLVHQRQKFFKGLVDAKTPIEVIRGHQKGCTDKKLLATACEELKKHCGVDSEIYKKLNALK